MVKRKGIACFMCVMFVSFATYSYGGGFCPPHKTEIIIDNEVTLDRISYDYGKSGAELTREYNESLNELSTREEASNIVGLYSHRNYVWYKNLKVVFDDRVNDHCPKKITVAFTVYSDNPTIYIARDHIGGNKGRVYTKWHEEEHSRIGIENVKRYLPYMEQRLRSYIEGVRIYAPKTNDDVMRFRRHIEKRVYGIISTNLRKLCDFIDALQEEFDAKEKENKTDHRYIYGDD